MIDQDALTLAIAVARAADAAHASDVVIFHVGDVLGVTEYFVVAGASNRRLVNAVVEDVEAAMKQQLDRAPVRVEGVREQQWVLVDYADVIVHVFLEEVREFYEIERLYIDVPKIEWTPDVSR